MNPLIRALDKKLEGLPDGALTILLVALALFALYVAMTGNPTSKALLAAWFIIP